MVRFIYSTFHLVALAATFDLGMDYVSAIPVQDPEVQEPAIPGWTHKGDPEKDCSWVAELPEMRCPRFEKSEEEWIPICEICPISCGAAGFTVDNCYPLRAVSDVRFNKLPPTNDCEPQWKVDSVDYEDGVHKKLYPLLPKHYPMEEYFKSDVVRNETKADSVVLADDIQLDDNNPLDYWMDNTWVEPLFPGDSEFWQELEHVVDIQIARRNNGANSTHPPSSFNTWPTLWSNLESLTDIAEAVHGEFPAIHQQNLLAKLMNQGFADRIKPLLYQYSARSKRDFLGFQAKFAEVNAWASSAVGPITFMLKWQNGMTRPEEIAWLISRGEITTDDGVPQQLVDKIQSMNMEVATDFTAYGEGSPTHPSWPSMHSAGSTISMWLTAIADLTGDEFCECLRTDYAVAYARTVAGVNFKQDIIGGLNLGKKIIHDKLPKFLAEKYGYNPSDVEERLSVLAEINWGLFDPATCTINGETTHEILGKLPFRANGSSC